MMVNNKLKDTIRPGAKLTVDEFMFPWYGRGAYFKDGIPAVMKISAAYCLCWKDKKTNTLVATCETTLPGLPSRKRRWDDEGNLFFREVARPKLIQQYFDGAAAIDIHNHIRQNGLALEKAWGT
ncbi:unnamed protein product [Parnassius apollo]|uniref:(apollo) hypothetical protein n=1 Tax=Parnassius apollo TaxID=110799 RepID=A0A8S3WMY8_PARAO|nr:unnamed protein product [Parnassius apollo]